MLTSSEIKAAAAAHGFDLCGVARAERYSRLARLSDWIAAGRAGEMQYLADSLDERLDPVRVLPSVRSVIALAVVYNTANPGPDRLRQGYGESAEAFAKAEGPGLHSCLAAHPIARYAQGDDYHVVLRTRLRALLAWMADRAPGLEAFSCVDDGPVQERVFAEQAGLGWIGKNTCLIHPDLGSWLFLGEILCNLELDADAPGLDRCGTCTRCIDACPTGAISEPYAVDATKCISYLTIETRGAVEEARRADVAHHLFGCDICQDVCPWNRRAATSDDPHWLPRAALSGLSLIEAAMRSDREWSAALGDSALRRAGLHRLRRTTAYALGESPDPARAEALDAMAREASAADPIVADAIAWARRRRT